jgi:hypothetical protein
MDGDHAGWSRRADPIDGAHAQRWRTKLSGAGPEGAMAVPLSYPR